MERKVQERSECEKEQWREDDDKFVKPTNRSMVTSKFEKCTNVNNKEKTEHEEKDNSNDDCNVKSKFATPAARKVLHLEVSPLPETISLADALRHVNSHKFLFANEASEEKQRLHSEERDIHNKHECLEEKEESDDVDSVYDKAKEVSRNFCHICKPVCYSSSTPRYNMKGNTNIRKRSKSIAYSESIDDRREEHSRFSKYSTRCQSLPCQTKLNSPHSSSLSTQIYNDYNLMESTSRLMSGNENSAYKHSFTHATLSEQKRNSYYNYNTPWNIFYPNGTKDLPPIRLHYLTLKHWQTRHTKNYTFSSKMPTLSKKVRTGNIGENDKVEQSKKSKLKDYLRRRRLVSAEQKVEWLHSIEPRNAFVFLVQPVQYEKSKTLTTIEPMSKENANTANNSSSNSESVYNSTVLQNITRLWFSKNKHQGCNVPLFARRCKEKQNNYNSLFHEDNEDSYSKYSYSENSYSYNNSGGCSFSVDESSPMSSYTNAAHGYTNNNEVNSTRNSSCCNNSERSSLVEESYDDHGSSDSIHKNTLNKTLMNTTQQHVIQNSGIRKSGNRHEYNKLNNNYKKSNKVNDSFSQNNVASSSFFSTAVMSTNSQTDCTNRHDINNDDNDDDESHSNYDFTPSWRTCDRESEWDSVSDTSRGQSSFAFHKNNNNILYKNIELGDDGTRGTTGVEAVVVLYNDVTGLDFNPRLTTSRLAIEAKHIRTFHFASYHEARMYFQHRRSTTKEEESSLEILLSESSESLEKNVEHKSKSHEANSENRNHLCVQKSNSSNCLHVDSESNTTNSENKKLEQSTVSHDEDDDAEENDEPVLISSHEDCMMCIYSADPHFIAVLRDIVMPFSYMTRESKVKATNDMSDKVQARLLKYVEVGMPSWAIFVASSNLPLYTRRCRKVVVALCHLWPLISLGVGCYDLYKHLPQLKVFLASITDPLARWVEHRLSVRVSMLLTYLLSVTVTTFTSLSELFPPLLLVPQLLIRLMWNVFSILHFPIVMIINILSWIGITIVSVVQFVYLFVRLLFIGPFLLLYELYLVVWYVIATLFMPFTFLLRVFRQTNVFTWLGSESLTGATATAKAVASSSYSPASSSSSSSSSSSTLLINWMWWSLEDWVEFWTTIASPIKNAMLGVWNSITSVTDMLFRREVSIRHWINIKYELGLCVLDEAKNIILYNMEWVYWFVPMREYIILLLFLLSVFTALPFIWSPMFTHFDFLKTNHDNSSVAPRAFMDVTTYNNNNSSNAVFNRSNQTFLARQHLCDEKSTQMQINITSTS